MILKLTIEADLQYIWDLISSPHRPWEHTQEYHHTFFGKKRKRKEERILALFISLWRLWFIRFYHAWLSHHTGSDTLHEWCLHGRWISGLCRAIILLHRGELTHSEFAFYLQVSKLTLCENRHTFTFKTQPPDIHPHLTNYSFHPIYLSIHVKHFWTILHVA